MSKPDERRVRRKTLVPPGESPKLLKVGTEVNALCPVKKLLNPSGLDWPQPWISVTGVIKQILVKNPIVYLVTVRGNHGFQEQEFDNICSSYHVEPLVSKWGSAEYEIERIVRQRPHAKHNVGDMKCPRHCHAETDYLIKWVGWTGQYGITWEPNLHVSDDSIDLFEEQVHLGGTQSNECALLFNAVTQGITDPQAQKEATKQVELAWIKHDCEAFTLCETAGPHCHETWDIVIKFKTIRFRWIAGMASSFSNPLFQEVLRRVPEPERTTRARMRKGGPVIRPALSATSHSTSVVGLGGPSGSFPAPSATSVSREVNPGGPSGSGPLPSRVIDTGGQSGSGRLPSAPGGGRTPVTSSESSDRALRSSLCTVCNKQRIQGELSLKCEKCSQYVHERCSVKSRFSSMYICNDCVTKTCSQCFSTSSALAQCLNCKFIFCTQDCSRIYTPPGRDTGMYCFSCSEPEYIEPNFQVSFSPLDFTDMVSPDDSTIFDSALGTSGNDIIQPSSAPTLHNRSTDPLLSVEETPAAEVGLDADPPASNQTMAAPLEAPTAQVTPPGGATGSTGIQIGRQGTASNQSFMQSLMTPSASRIP